MDLLLSEQLLLIALTGPGRPATAGQPAIRVGVAGGVVMELLLRGLVTHERGLVAVAPATGRTGDGAIDRAVDQIRASKLPRELKYWIRALATPALTATLLNRMAADSVIRSERVRVLWLFRATRYREVNSRVRAELVAGLERAIFGGTDLDPRTRALVTLVAACRLLDQVVPRERLRDGRRLAKAIAASDTGGQAVSAVIRAVEAEMTAVMTAATTAATTS